MSRFEESYLQQNCKRWFDSHWSELSCLFFSVPNGANVSDKNRMRLVAEGMTAGVADMLLLLPSHDGKYFSLGVEFKKKTAKVVEVEGGFKLKTGKGRSSKFQVAWKKVLKSHGGRYEVICEQIQFELLMIDYLGFPEGMPSIERRYYEQLQKNKVMERGVAKRRVIPSR